MSFIMIYIDQMTIPLYGYISKTTKINYTSGFKILKKYFPRRKPFQLLNIGWTLCMRVKVVIKTLNNNTLIHV